MKQQTENADRAKPIRIEISKFLKAQLCNEKGKLPQSVREDLAEFLGQSVSQAEKVVYYGQGSFDALVSALQYALKIKPESAADSLNDMLMSLRKHLLVDEADRKWFNLPISKNKRIYYASLIEHAEKLADEILLDD